MIVAIGSFIDYGPELTTFRRVMNILNLNVMVLVFGLYNSSTIGLMSAMRLKHRLAYNGHIRKMLILFFATDFCLIMYLFQWYGIVMASFCTSHDHDSILPMFDENASPDDQGICAGVVDYIAEQFANVNEDLYGMVVVVN